MIMQAIGGARKIHYVLTLQSKRDIFWTLETKCHSNVEGWISYKIGYSCLNAKYIVLIWKQSTNQTGNFTMQFKHSNILLHTHAHVRVHVYTPPHTQHTHRGHFNRNNHHIATWLHWLLWECFRPSHVILKCISWENQHSLLNRPGIGWIRQ